MRVEDLDEARTQPGATAAMLDELRWLGLAWEEGPDIGGPFGPYVQSERRKLYEAALALLENEHKVYPCSCSRRDVELASQAPHGADPVYPGTCRGRDPNAVVDEARARNRGVSWRFAVAEGIVAIDDRCAGEYAQDVAREVGDFIVYRADGVPAYQLAVVVDDIAMAIREVVRGDDLLASAPRQVLLYRAFGATAPAFAHVPLVVGDDGIRLAKRHGSISIAELRRRGVSANRIIAALLESLGTHDGIDRARFDPRAIPRGPVALAMLRRSLPEIG
jgi:glutamyl-tRNA synthetase